MEEKGLRINKYIADAGICSRREADRRIAEGRVTIDDVVARDIAFFFDSLAEVGKIKLIRSSNRFYSFWHI